MINLFEKVTCDEDIFKKTFLKIYFDTEYDLDQCDLNKRNEILHELVKNYCNQ